MGNAGEPRVVLLEGPDLVPADEVGARQDTGKPGGDLATAVAAPWLGMLFLVPCALVWRAGVRRYLSAGS